MKFVLVGGNTQTARVDGISAAGSNPDAMVHTPGADLEVVEYGELLRAPVVPVSSSGCPTPGMVTRAARELLGFEVLSVDAGLARPTGAPTVTIGDEVGEDVRQPEPVPTARATFERARRLGRSLPDEELFVGETIPGGTTTALGVLTALGERPTVSSSLPENPLARKRAVVEEAMAASGLSPGDTAADPVETLQYVGDPVLAAVAGVVVGAAESAATVTLAGGTQMAAAGALVRHSGVSTQLSLATTTFVADDETAAIDALAADVDLDLTVTDPGFDEADHPVMDAYVGGEAKEGVGMGGALSLVDRSSIPMADLRDRVRSVYERIVSETSPDGRWT